MDNSESKSVGFEDMGLDDRIQYAIATLGWKAPTLVQQKAIPYFLQGKDVLARARTGSGKTAAYLVPLIQKIIEDKINYYNTEQELRAVILAPSKELCKQIGSHIEQLVVECKRDVTFVDLSPQVPLHAQRALLENIPDIIISTPLKILSHLEAQNINLKKSLKFLIIDEADLMFAFDHQKEIEKLLGFLPSIYQAFVTSATMGEDVKSLKKLILHNPVVLKLEEPPLPATDQLTQYVIKVEELDKALLLYSLFRLNMIRGKTIIFVSTVDKGYKIRMFLSQFGINSCILNSELPVASRCSVVDQFNKGHHNNLIASDEIAVKDPKNMKNRKKDRESGVSRGIDFHFVSNVINFDFPLNTDAYIHRVGRSARGVSQGTALSMVSHKEMNCFQSVESSLRKLMPDTEKVFQDFKFNLDQLEGFKYRANDAWRTCTRIAVRDMRRREIRSEILNSTKLKSYFKEHPKDLQIIKHGIHTKGLTSQPHLRNVPEYNIPSNLRSVAAQPPKTTRIDKRKNVKTVHKKAKFLKKKDPLRSMKFDGFKKK